jgi:hypothetical protein
VGPEARRQQSWYIRLGRGARFRALNLPLVLTRKMEHYVRRAPDHYTVSHALRYGETRGLGGSEGLACEVAIGRLGRNVEHPAFWRTVLGFFVAHPETKLEHVNPIIDFIHASKFGGEEVLTEDGAERRAPPLPAFSMKGPTLSSLLRLVTAWHAELAVTRERGSFSWKRCGVQPYRFLEKRSGDEPDRDWTILELVDSAALQAEGRAMHHCVYSYAQRCRRGETTIWSLRLRVNGREKRMATIEVEPRGRAIVQVRAQCNRPPGARSAAIIRQWSGWAGLRLDVRG